MINTKKTAFYFLYGLVTFGVLSIPSACTLRPSYPPEVATPKKMAVSPSEKYILNVSLQDGELTFQILDNKTGKLVFSPPNVFLSRFTTFFSWDKNDRVWVYTGDTGTYYWKLNQYTNKWEEYSKSESGVPVPEYFNQERPRSFSIPPEIASLEKPAISPSGQYVLKVISVWENKAQWFYFQILDREGKIIYSPTEKFYARRLNRFLWDDRDRVWVSSYADKSNPSKNIFYQESERSLEHSEIIYFWEQNNYGEWGREDFYKNRTIPNFYKNQLQEPNYLLNH